MSKTKIKAIGSIIAFTLFFAQFNIYDSLNTQFTNLELSGMRYEIAANGSHLNQLLFKQNKNPDLLINASKSANTSFRNNMNYLGVDEKTKNKYLWELDLLPLDIKGLKDYNEFVNKYNQKVDLFLDQEYNPKLKELKSKKNFYRWSIIILTSLFISLNFFLELNKDQKS